MAVKQGKLNFSFHYIDKARTAEISVDGLQERKSHVLFLHDITNVSSIENLVSYMNQLSETIEKWKEMTDKLLKSGLSGRNLNRIQDEAAKMLSYADISEYIDETFRRKDEPETLQQQE